MKESLIYTLAAAAAAVSVTHAQIPDPLNFKVAGSATFTCSVDGSRCAFSRSDFTSIDFGTGQELDVLSNAVWAANDVESDVLQLTCATGSCLVTCNSWCDCQLEDGSDCPTTTLFPTAAPNTAAPMATPKEATCPRQTENIAICPELMKVVPVGTFCDCYNFCYGKFISCCQSDNQCGLFQCNRDIGDGSATLGRAADEVSQAGIDSGLVMGCTDFDRPADWAETPTVPGSEGSSASGVAVSVAGAMLVVSLVATIGSF